MESFINSKNDMIFEDLCFSFYYLNNKSDFYYILQFNWYKNYNILFL